MALARAYAGNCMILRTLGFVVIYAFLEVSVKVRRRAYTLTALGLVSGSFWAVGSCWVGEVLLSVKGV